jgi:hypothetical protein
MAIHPQPAMAFALGLLAGHSQNAGEYRLCCWQQMAAEQLW